MAKRREGRHDEVMLIPFLDILCSLIGVLILIIVVLCVAQTQQAKGRSAEDLAQSIKHQNLRRALQTQKSANDTLIAKIDALEKLRAEMSRKEDQIIELRKRLDMTGEAAKTNKELATRLQKKVEELVVQIEAVKKEIPPIEAEIERLKKELAERKKKPDAKPPPILVRPSGSGSAAGHKVFFVEVSGPSLILHKDKGAKTRIAAASASVDKDYAALLQTVKNSPNAKLIFLIRKDGHSAYVQAAGFAEQAFGLITAKLPLPTDGEVDLNLFNPR